MKISVDRASIKWALIEDTISYVDYLRSLSTRNRKTRKIINDAIVSLEDLLGVLSGISPGSYRGSNHGPMS